MDTDLFRPDALDLAVLGSLNGGRGRGPDQQRALEEKLDSSKDPEELLRGLKEASGAYGARAHDRDAGDRLATFLGSEVALIVYLGKLIHPKGVHSLISAFAPVHEETGARLLVIGFGTFGEGLQALFRALDTGDEGNARCLAERGRLLEGGPAGPLEHFEPSGFLLRAARGFGDSVVFVGPPGHAELANLLPVADAAVVPSIFPETSGLVAAEFAAAGVVPFVADHSGLREAGAFVGQDLPFDLRVPMEGFEENLRAALGGFLARPGGGGNTPRPCGATA